ncbi:MAG: hypothetical protein KKC01_06585 [Gammaproteobacteria bacterium]|nr:hypothetical protein [Gammaproteobacteria bacterium]
MTISFNSFGWHDVVGLAGVVMLLGTYFALQIDRIDSQSLAYSLLNGISAVLILVSLLYTFNWASFIIEIFWISISLIGIVRWMLRR